ncbi:HGGxSTG domain-containing protein [Microbacterium lacticum]|uniref:HGGxSTG domain-containing protein n=1 Tax=Microbacterium lacticum TaxID=33885 RepID=UPI0028D3F542|nr:HGGxSTG domain-containing protein [Microbacterium lacticum]
MCGARRKKGGTCRAPALTGQTRCRSHGGATPQAKRAARDRLAEEADPSISRLVDLRDNAASEQVRAKAATTLLEMAGYGRHVKHDVNVMPPAEARRKLLAAILELRAGSATETDAEQDVIDAEIVEEVTDHDD